MEEKLAELLRWHLQVRRGDQVGFLPFRSRSEALAHAQALLREYGPTVEIILGSPWGETEPVPHTLAHSGSG